MKRNTFVMVGIASVIMVSGLGALTSYATSSGGTVNNQEAQATHISITTYRQATVKGLGNWEQQSDGTWKFKLYTNGYLANAWVESLAEENAYYFLNAEGIMLTNAVTPDNYKVDSTGIWKLVATEPAPQPTAAPAQIESQVNEIREAPVETMPEAASEAIKGYYEEMLEKVRSNPEYQEGLKNQKDW